jgi:hypothetical protein
LARVATPGLPGEQDEAVSVLDLLKLRAGGAARQLQAVGERHAHAREAALRVGMQQGPVVRGVGTLREREAVAECCCRDGQSREPPAGTICATRAINASQRASAV